MAEAKSKVYYARAVQFSFKLPFRDDKGEVIPHMTDGGNKQYEHGKLVIQRKLCKFTGLVGSPKSKTGYLCQYVTGRDQEISESDEIQVLDALVADRASSVMSQAQYDKLYRATETAEARAVKAEKEAAEVRERLAAMEEELAKLRKAPTPAASAPAVKKGF